MDTGPQPDVIIIGGGVVGSAIAYFLAANSTFDGRVLVIEPDPTYEHASTPRSLGSIRQQFSTPENIQMSAFGADFIRHAETHLSVDGDCPALGFKEGGYLFLASEEGRSVLHANRRVQQRYGADNALLTPAQLGSRFPWLCVDDIACGCLGLSGEGWLDAYALLRGFRAKAIQLGGRYLKARVCALERAEDRIVAARLDTGERIVAGSFVNAAGPRAREVAQMAAVSLPVSPRKRLVFVIQCRTPLPGCPLVIDPSGLYFRPEGAFYVCGIGPRKDEDLETLELDVDYNWFNERMWPGLARRVPAFEAIKVHNAWAGHYAMNTFDANAILGPHPELANFYFANGFSGHGLQQSPAVGRALSELIAYGEYRSLDLTRLGYERITRGEPIVERNVV